MQSGINLPTLWRTCCLHRKSISDLKSRIFSVTSQLYYPNNQLHVSATVASHHRAEHRNKKKCTAAKMVGDLGPHIVLRNIHVPVYVILILIYLLNATGLTTGGSSTVHIYTQTVHRTTHLTTNWEECGPCPDFSSHALAFVLKLRKKQGKI